MTCQCDPPLGEGQAQEGWKGCEAGKRQSLSRQYSLLSTALLPLPWVWMALLIILKITVLSILKDWASPQVSSFLLIYQYSQ